MGTCLLEDNPPFDGRQLSPDADHSRTYYWRRPLTEDIHAYKKQDLVVSVELHQGLIPKPLTLIQYHYPHVPYPLVLILSKNLGGGSWRSCCYCCYCCCYYCSWSQKPTFKVWLKLVQEQRRYCRHWVCGGGGWIKVIFMSNPTFELSWGWVGVVTIKLLLTITQTSPWQLVSIKEGPRNLHLNFGQNRGH